MAYIKTKPGEYDVDDFIKGLDEQQQRESHALINLMKDVTKQLPIMYGSSIIGFDSYHYRSKSGSEGIWPRIGFSPRKGKISLYLTFDAESYLSYVEGLGGKNSIGKGCIYLQKFDRVDQSKLRALIEQAYKDSFDSTKSMEVTDK